MFSQKTCHFSVIFKSIKGFPGESMGQVLQPEGTIYVQVRASAFKNLKIVFTRELLRSHLFISVAAESKGQTRFQVV